MLWVLIWIASTSRCNSNEYPHICLYQEVKKKYTGCNLKTMEFLDCALIGVCAVIRSNTVYAESLPVQEKIARYRKKKHANTEDIWQYSYWASFSLLAKFVISMMQADFGNIDIILTNNFGYCFRVLTRILKIGVPKPFLKKCRSPIHQNRSQWLLIQS